MISNYKDLLNVLSSEFKSRGFKKKGDNWYFENDDCLQMINVQKSDFGGQYYLNTGILLRELDRTNFPKEFQCHIRGRLEQIFPDEKVADIFDLENSKYPGEERRVKLERLLREKLFTYLDNMITVDKIRHSLANGIYKGLLVMLPAKNILGV